MKLNINDIKDELEYKDSDFEYSVQDNECELGCVVFTMSKHIFQSHIKDNLMDDYDLLGFTLEYSGAHQIEFSCEYFEFEGEIYIDTIDIDTDIVTFNCTVDTIECLELIR